MDFNLSGRIALVSGSGRGIGMGIADVLLSEGCSVFVNDIDSVRLDTAVRILRTRTNTERAFPVLGDLTDTDTIAEAFATVEKALGEAPDIVIANIGSGRSVPGWDVSDDEWLRMFNLNFFGTVRLCREAIRAMEKRGGGAIICIASIAGCEAIAAPVAYSTAKAAVLSFVKNTADAVAPLNIRINAISPGNVFFEEGTWDIKMKQDRENALEYIRTYVPLNDFATPSDIGHATAFLASDRARFITGTNFVVDGGQVRKFI